MGSDKENLLSAVVPLLKLITLTLIGLFLAHPKFQILPRATFKLLSKLIFALFLPCLIFTVLGKCITLNNIALWWFIPINVLLSTLIGCILGCVVALVCRPPRQFFRFTIVMTAFGNTGSLPIAIIGSVCHSKDNPFGPKCEENGVAYVSFAQWVSVILVYTFVYHMMEPPLQYYEVVQDEVEIEEDAALLDIEEDAELLNNDVSSPLLVEAEWPGIEDKETEHSKTPFIARLFQSISSISHSVLPDIGELRGEASTSVESIRCLAAPRVVRKIRIVAEKTPIRHILQPPTIASLLAIVVGLVPQLKSFCFGREAPLSFLTDSFQILAGAAIPSVMLILGGMLAEGPNESKLGIRTTIGITVARLLVLPLVGVGVVALAENFNVVIHEDPMYRFVLLLQYATPSAILLAAIASLRGYAASEASALLFWQHIFAIFSLSIYVILYFKLFLHN
ncbi:hypothetical protein Scep_016742 [Stephania cephalantha]|uniref:Uncharacterized protein n=1 Tax=Stephania cephalantha TaxID=152367 RepID=A0AAP0IN65_9MAGN